MRRRTFIAGCTVGLSSLAVGTASAASETVDVKVTSRGDRTTRFEDFRDPTIVGSQNTEITDTTLQYNGHPRNPPGEPTIDGSGSYVQPAGSGTSDDPYRVTTLNEFQYIDQEPTKYYEMQNDIILPDIPRAEETGIYFSSGYDRPPILQTGGVFDGQGHVFRNFYVDRKFEGKTGMFEEVQSGAEVRDFAVSGEANTPDENQIGLAVGLLRGTAKRIAAFGKVVGTHNVGGCFGEIREGTARNCYADVEAIGKDGSYDTDGPPTAGIAGLLKGTTDPTYAVLKKCYANVRFPENNTGNRNIGPCYGNRLSNTTRESLYFNSDTANTNRGDETPVAGSKLKGSSAPNNVGLDFTNTWETTVASGNPDIKEDSFPRLQSIDGMAQVNLLGAIVPTVYWVDRWDVNKEKEYRVSVDVPDGVEVRIAPDPPTLSQSPNNNTVMEGSYFYVRLDWVDFQETIPDYKVEVDTRNEVGKVSVGGSTKTLDRVLDPGEEVFFTTDVALNTGYQIDVTGLTSESDPILDVEIRGSKIRQSGGAIVLRESEPIPRGSLYAAPEGESILWIPEVDQSTWQFEMIPKNSSSGDITVQDLDLSGYVTTEELNNATTTKEDLNLSEYVKESELDQKIDSDTEVTDDQLQEYEEREGGLPPSNSGPIDQLSEFAQGVVRSVSEEIQNLRRSIGEI